MSEQKPFDLLQSLRVMTLPACSQGWLKDMSDQFWSNQDHVLDCMEKLHHDWLARRHEGTREARNAAAAILSAENQAAAASECQKWAIGALNRILADASSLQQLQSAAAISMFEPISSPLGMRTPPSRIASLSGAT